ncbi:cytidine deaminase [Streptococcus phocae subsp. phocae]|uniref:Cytidine deaminase n=1 Tax=Streptococcus phocae TaxID=119224 RepID=A0A0P6SP38_9STRE|nr:cytidine deaminase [Streptococcus phocae]KPJ23209.1 cytidine deaminase [Streptococcus phocae]
MVATDLISLAIAASKNAYVPYSHFPVGAALKTKDGHIYTGCNVENASFGLSNCAERTAIFKAVSEGHQQFSEIAIYGETQSPISPCGACRQVMSEFCDATTPVTLIAKDGRTETRTVGDLLPYSFTDLS